MVLVSLLFITTLISLFLFLVILWPKNKCLVPKKILLAPIIKHLPTYGFNLSVFITQFIFLFIILIISPYFISNSDPEKFEDISILLIHINMYLIPLSLLVTGSKFLFERICKGIKDINRLTKDTKEFKYIITSIFLTIFLIMTLPAAFFGVIYGLLISFATYPSNFEEIFSLDSLYYSMAISYSLPIDTSMSKIAEVKILPIVQVIIQKFIDIFLLGYIATVLTQVIYKFKKNIEITDKFKKDDGIKKS